MRISYCVNSERFEAPISSLYDFSLYDFSLISYSSDID